MDNDNKQLSVELLYRGDAEQITTANMSFNAFS